MMELLINTELKLKLSGWLAVRKTNIGEDGDDDGEKDGKVIRRIYYHFARKNATIVCQPTAKSKLNSISETKTEKQMKAKKSFSIWNPLALNLSWRQHTFWKDTEDACWKTGEKKKKKKRRGGKTKTLLLN